MDLLLNLLDGMQQHPHIAGALFVLAVAVIMAVGIPGGNLLLLTAGVLFGPWLGAVYTLCGLMLGAWATHALIFHTFGRWLNQRAGDGQGRWRRLAAEENAPLLILPRLVPLIPFFLINVAYASVQVPLKTYLWTTLVGQMPTAFLLARVGSRFSEPRSLDSAEALAVLMSGEVLLPLAVLMTITLTAWLLLRLRSSG